MQLYIYIYIIWINNEYIRANIISSKNLIVGASTSLQYPIPTHHLLRADLEATTIKLHTY